MDETLDLDAQERALEQQLAAIRRLKPKPVLYPTWRYHATLEPRIVRSPQEDAALGPDWADAPITGNAPPPPTPTPAMKPSLPVVTDPVDAQLAEELYKATVDQVVAELPRVDDLEEVRKTLARERRNPKHTGGRKTIVHAIEGRIEKLEREARAGA